MGVTCQHDLAIHSPVTQATLVVGYGMVANVDSSFAASFPSTTTHSYLHLVEAEEEKG